MAFQQGGWGGNVRGGGNVRTPHKPYSLCLSQKIEDLVEFAWLFNIHNKINYRGLLHFIPLDFWRQWEQEENWSPFLHWNHSSEEQSDSLHEAHFGM